MRFILLCERPVRKQALSLHRKNEKKDVYICDLNPSLPNTIGERQVITQAMITNLAINTTSMLDPTLKT